VLVFLAVLATLLVSYRACTSSGQGSPDGSRADLAGADGGFEDRSYQLSGAIDAENHFDMTVMGTTDDPSKAARALDVVAFL
jgi:hypothetical protein